MTIEIPPAGTHGAIMPSGRIQAVFGSVYAALYRALGGRVVGGHLVLLTTVGAKSGKQRVASVRRFDDGAGRWMVVGSAGGAAKHPAWFINLARNPDKVSLQVGPERCKVRPELLHGEERAAAWSRIVKEAPQFGGYTSKTDRELPVVRLTREADGGA